MSAAVTEEFGAGRLFEGATSDQLQQQRCQSGEGSPEWRFSDQVENGTPSTSPPHWDSDDDDDGGLKPSDLYGNHTWKIEKFSKINKRELRSNAFEVGGYKWYILIYPQGCDVCNHLSLFLCVANHDKLLPGWSHFAQFTIAVVNKDPKKSKYSDTLHRFWKKEHDWGWKKFMEISKVKDDDGFVEADTLTIKAQVQVIRERADRPFRCLHHKYRRELLRVYLSNVEQICWRFVEERRGKLGKLIEDKARWSSFCTFWLGMDQNSRRCMSREKAETILKVVVKNFFIEKEVTSTLVMDSLYSGLRALEGQYKGKKSQGKYVEADELPVPIVRMEKEMFVLVDDVLPLLERAAIEPLPPRDEKGPQNRTKDGTLGEESNKDCIEHVERRLTELGCRTIEIFILAHVFNKIEVAYQEAVSLKKQEELIREEEAAWLAETEQRVKRGTVDKEKKSKKKQAKQKRNNRKSKDKEKYDKFCSTAEDKIEHDICIVKKKDSIPTDSQALREKLDTVEDGSDISDSADCVQETLALDSEERDVNPVSWDTDTSEMHPPAEACSSGILGLTNVQNGTKGRSSSVVDDSSSSCSSDSVPFVTLTVPQKGSYQKNKKSSSRGINHQSKSISDRAGWAKEEAVRASKAVVDKTHQINGSQSSTFLEPPSSLDRVDEDAGSSRKSDTKGVDAGSSLPRSPSKSTPSMTPRKSDSKVNVAGLKSPSNRVSQSDRPTREEHLAENAAKLDTQKFATPRSTGKPTNHQLHEIEKPPAQPVTTDKPAMTSTPVISRPLSAPLTPGSVPAVSVVSVVPSTPILARSVSATGRLGLEPTAPTSQTHPRQSYRNAIMGGSLPAFNQNHLSSSVANTPVSYSQSPSSSVANTPVSYSQSPSLVSSPLFSPHSSDWMDPNQVDTSFSFRMINHRDRLQNGPILLDSYQRENSRNLLDHRGSLFNGMQNFDLYRQQDPLESEISVCTSGRQNPVLQDEFPHLDIIENLLDDEHGSGNLAMLDHRNQNFANNGFHHLNRHYSFPGDPGMSNGLPTSSCRFERARSYQEDVIKHGYGAPHDALRTMIPQTGSRPYLIGLIDSLVPNQWQMPDLPFQSARATDNDTSPYQTADYQNGYVMFRHSNGF